MSYADDEYLSSLFGMGMLEEPAGELCVCVLEIWIHACNLTNGGGGGIKVVEIPCLIKNVIQV